MVDTQPRNYESLSQPGLKELLDQRASKYRKEALVYGGLVVGSAVAEGVVVWNAVTNKNFTSLGYLSAYMVSQAGIATTLMINRFGLARKFSSASESIGESKINYNTAPHDFKGLQTTLEAVVDLPEKKLTTSHRLLEIAKYQEQRMPFVNKYENTGDIGMLEAQKDMLQANYLEATLKEEEFVMPELKTITTDNDEFALVKDAWVRAKIAECDWAVAVAKGDKEGETQNDWMFYATNMRLDQGLNGKLVEKAAVIINNRGQQQ